MKEILPVVLACAVWGPQWRGRKVVAHVDNEGAVAVLNSGSSKEGQIMHLMRSLFFILAHYQISLRACHVPGAQNGIADAISRDKLSLFLLAAGSGPNPDPSFGATRGAPGYGAARLAVDGLAPVIQELFSAGLAASSLRSYAAGQNRYARFCDRYSISPYPTSEEKLSHFVAYLFVEGLSDGTVKVYLSAVRHAQIGLGLGDPRIPDMPRICPASNMW